VAPGTNLGFAQANAPQTAVVGQLGAGRENSAANYNYQLSTLNYQLSTINGIGHNPQHPRREDDPNT
jgi:hypothetical protein